MVVVDDAAMAITHVIRGEDHIANTAKQLLLYDALGLPTPQFAHAPLILNGEGRKLSKRDGVTSINDFRAMGYTAAAIANYMTLLGWSVPEGMNERFSLGEAAEVFSFDRVNKAGARFDWDKLNWLNGQVLHPAARATAPGCDAAVDIRGLVASWGSQLGCGLCELLGPSLTLIKDSVEQASPFFVCPDLADDGVKQLAVEGAKTAISHLVTALETDP